MIGYALLRLRRHWRSSLAVLLCMTLSSALAVSFSSYAGAVAQRELNQSLEEADPAERNLLITGTRYSFSEELHRRLEEILGPVLEDWLVIRHAWSPADQPTEAETKGMVQDVSALDIYSFSGFAEHVRVIEGRLPAQVRLWEAVASWRPPPMEVVIGRGAAQQSGYGIGDRLTGSKTYHRLEIVGIVEPVDPDGDVWGEDLRAFEIIGDVPGLPADTIALPLIIDPSSMQSYYPDRPVFLHDVSWRITLKRGAITAAQARELSADLVNLQTQSATIRATISTDLVQILTDFLSRLSHVQMALFLLTAQAYVLILYALTVLTSFLAERAEIEVFTLSGRGIGSWRIAQQSALENLMLALPAALLLGPGLAQTALYVWGRVSGDTLPLSVPAQSWVLSVVAVGLGWGTLVVPIFLSARHAEPGGGATRARPAAPMAIQKRYLDLYLLAFGALLYWQLARTGSFVMQRLAKTQLADPLLLIGPSILVIAAAIVSLRFLPLLLTVCARLVGRRRGLVLPLGLFRLAREPQHPGRVILLIALTAGLVLFARTFGDSLALSQQAAALHLAGADLRLSLDQPTNLSADQLAGHPGVRALTTTLRGAAAIGDGGGIQLLAVDPDTFERATRDALGLVDSHVGTAMVALKSGGEVGADAQELRAVLSRDALPVGTAQGDRLLLSLEGRWLPLSVALIVEDFPTLSGPFAVMSLPALEARLGADFLTTFGSREAWLQLDPVEDDRVVEHPSVQGRVLDDRQTRLRALHSDALAQGVNNILQLDAVSTVLFSLAVFFLIQQLAAHGRIHEFGILQALGISVRQAVALLGFEDALLLLLGMLAGAAVGLGLSHIMIPFLSQALAESLGGVYVQHVLVDWSAVLRLYGLLAAVFSLALTIHLLLFARTRTHWLVGTGEE